MSTKWSQLARRMEVDSKAGENTEKNDKPSIDLNLWPINHETPSQLKSHPNALIDPHAAIFSLPINYNAWTQLYAFPDSEPGSDANAVTAPWFTAQRESSSLQSPCYTTCKCDHFSRSVILALLSDGWHGAICSSTVGLFWLPMLRDEFLSPHQHEASFATSPSLVRFLTAVACQSCGFFNLPNERKGEKISAIELWGGGMSNVFTWT